MSALFTTTRLAVIRAAVHQRSRLRRRLSNLPGSVRWFRGDLDSISLAAAQHTAALRYFGPTNDRSGSFRDGVEPPAARPCPLCDFESTTIKPARYRIGPNQENPQNACLAARPVRCGARYLLTELTQQAERGRGAQ